jgi:cell division protein FtsB
MKECNMPRRQARSQRHAPKHVESQDKRLGKLNKLTIEYDNLKAERAKLREEIAGLDSKVASGDISKKRHDKEFRLKLARAGEISRRIAEVIGEMAKLGRIPEDHQK